MRLAYVAGPYSAPTPEGIAENVRAARRLGIELAKAVPGVLPMVPHLLSGGETPEDNWGQSYEWWCAATLEVMRRCDMVLMMPGWERSKGAMAEHLDACTRSMVVCYSIAEVAQWMEGQR